MKKHDEERDVVLLCRSGIKVDAVKRVVIIPANYQQTKPIGLKRWARIDYLTNHCGYVIVRNDSQIVRLNQITESAKDLAKRKAKDERREYSKKKSRTMMNA